MWSGEEQRWSCLAEVADVPWQARCTDADSAQNPRTFQRVWSAKGIPRQALHIILHGRNFVSKIKGKEMMVRGAQIVKFDA